MSHSASNSQANASPSFQSEAAPSYSYEKDAVGDEEDAANYQTESYQSGNTLLNQQSISSQSVQNQNQNQNQSQNQNHVLFDSSIPQQYQYSDSVPNQQRGGPANPSMSMPISMPSNNLNPTQNRGFGLGNAPNLGRPDHASYATSSGYSISNLAAAPWFLPPFSSVYVLVVETENDLARFHAYQSGLCGVAFFFLMWFLRSWLGWYTLSVIIGMAFYGWSWVCSQTAHRAAPTLTRMPYLPYFAEVAEKWVGEE